MSDATPFRPGRTITGLPHDLMLGILYWLGFLLLLEPGNIAATLHDGRQLDAGREALRIAGGAALGACATPALLGLVRRFPVRAEAAVAHAVLQALAAAVVATAMIVVSCPLAAWMIGGPASLGEAIRGQLTENWALVVLGIAVLLAGAHAFRPAEPTAAPTYLAAVTVRSGRRTLRLDLRDVDWIETQGNYLALHADGGAHLVRAALRGFEPGLDPGRFARIHRRTVVALDRIVEVTWLDGGDADVRLRDGTVLRLSRSYRRALKDRLY